MHPPCLIVHYTRVHAPRGLFCVKHPKRWSPCWHAPAPQGFKKNHPLHEPAANRFIHAGRNAHQEYNSTCVCMMAGLGVA
jgi:hypothetical protein